MPLTAVFQPIVNLVDGTVLGYEALGRMAGREDDGFDPVLQWARQSHRTAVMYRRVQSTAIESAVDRPGGTLLFLNGRLSNLPSLRSKRLPWSQIVLEVPESDRRLQEWRTALSELRHLGLQVAIDDWGVGMADPLRLIQLEPEWVKIDVALVRQIHHPQVSRLVDLLVRWVAPSTRLIAEGIETPEQLDALRQLGVTYGQGFGLARPGRLWPVNVGLPSASPRTAGLQLVPLALGQAAHLSEEAMALVGQARGELRPLFARAVPEFVDWLFATPMASRFIGLDQPRHVRILLEHFDLLTRGTLDQSDVDRAARIARAHQRYGIDLAYYVMGYRLIQASMAHSLQDQRQEHLADALRGLFDWDMSVVLQAYQNLLDRDALTGALTAQAFWDRVEQDLLQATTTNRAATLVVLDLDGVRRANHLEGHIAGDHLIASLGTLVQEFSASSYLVGRIGGDLFGLWTQYRELPLIRRDLESLQQQLSENHPGLTFFFGIAVLGRHGTTVSALYARADKELYRRRRAAALGGKAVSRHQSPLMSGVGQVTGE